MKKFDSVSFVLLILLMISGPLIGQSINPGEVPSVQSVLSSLRNNHPDLSALKSKSEDEAAKDLAGYLKTQMANRYYFSWIEFSERFEQYGSDYPDQFETHAALSKYQMSRYAPDTQWILPFNNLKGNPVTAYELRHLARQQKSVDMALMFYQNNQDPVYYDYWMRQVKDLNRAFSENAYDDAGNGIYEVYRAGKRIHNWLFCHNAYLASPLYTWQDQITVIATFLHHGAQLQKRSARNRYGNHHTKGLVALFEISVLLRDFAVTDQWREQAVAGLTWHLQNEVNPDGFQFERSVHYHKGDIENYFRVYQLARINRIPLPDVFLTQIKKLFESLVMLAQPNRRLPVLQDDTDSPFTENNSMDDAMVIGTILFEDPSFRYFTGSAIPAEIYWLLSSDQLQILQKIVPQVPQTGSTELRETGYYTMRNGWEINDCYMTVTAGLSEYKPDHQHGDMLGVVAYANGNEILPNYQVAYKYPDFPFWKNSFAKNVAIVDSIPQGRDWNANSGGSGFGKWNILPVPTVHQWIMNDQFDYFCGSHNGFTDLDVEYYREILFVKEGFWIIRDHFNSESTHRYQQIWQGQFKEGKDSASVRRNFDDGSGIEIIQLKNLNTTPQFGTHRDKGNVLFASEPKTEQTFTTLIYPFRSETGHPGRKSQTIGLRKNWQIKRSEGGKCDLSPEINSNAEWTISREASGGFLINVSRLIYQDKEILLEPATTLFINKTDRELTIMLLEKQSVQIISGTAHISGQIQGGKVLIPGTTYLIQ